MDAFRFEQLVQDGAAAAERGDHEQASALLRAALALWRGQALADVADTPFARGAATRLNDQHLLALERRIESDLKLGRAQDLVPELEALVASHPYHEPFHRQLMLALYRSGRQSEALAAFRRARGLLADELGIEPGPDLRRMEQAILRQDPELEQPPAAPPQPPALRNLPRPVPARPGSAIAPKAAPQADAHRRRAGARGRGRGRACRLRCGRRGRGRASPANGIGVLSASGTSVTSALAMPSALASLAVGGGSVWATSPEGNAVYRIDPATRAITQAIAVGAGPGGIAYGDGDVWVANASDGTVSRIDSWPARWCRRSAQAPNPPGSRPASGRCGSPIRWEAPSPGSTRRRAS